MQLHRGRSHYGRNPVFVNGGVRHHSETDVDRYPDEILNWAHSLVSGRTRLPNEQEYDLLVARGIIDDPWTANKLARLTAARERRRQRDALKRAAKKRAAQADKDAKFLADINARAKFLADINARLAERAESRANQRAIYDQVRKKIKNYPLLDPDTDSEFLNPALTERLSSRQK